MRFLHLWLIALHIIGVSLFAGGYFLTRFEVSENATCSVQGNCKKPAFSKAIVLVIDALRDDFTFAQNVEEERAPQFVNHLPALDEMLKVSPTHNAMYQFVADPPATTMQRLKGLTCGTLPTFIDISDSFTSAAINEDNFIDQAVAAGKTLVFYGDDTWMSLFPEQFKESKPFPSFNVNDFETVDNGVIENILPKIEEDDWDIIVAHTLGVDHIGHTHSPFHEAMGTKLDQMNQLIMEIENKMDDDTLLVIMGDHGMTDDGNHGGAHPRELAAGLFLHSKGNPLRLDSFDQTHLFLNGLNDEQHLPLGTKVPSIAQIDLVPTLSQLLGLPIPFSNLGAIVPELMIGDYSDENVGPITSVLQATLRNARQVLNYLKSYSIASGRSVGDVQMKKLEHLIDNASFIPTTDSAAQMNSIEKLIDLIHETADLCRNEWTEFNMIEMAWGVFILGAALICHIIVLVRSLINGSLDDDVKPSISDTNCVVVGATTGLLIALITMPAVSIPMPSAEWFDMIGLPAFESFLIHVPLLPVVALGSILFFIGAQLAWIRKHSLLKPLWDLIQPEHVRKWYSSLIGFVLSLGIFGLVIVRLSLLVSDLFIEREGIMINYLAVGGFLLLTLRALIMRCKKATMWSLLGVCCVWAMGASGMTSAHSEISFIGTILPFTLFPFVIRAYFSERNQLDDDLGPTTAFLFPLAEALLMLVWAPGTLFAITGKEVDEDFLSNIETRCARFILSICVIGALAMIYRCTHFQMSVNMRKSEEVEVSFNGIDHALSVTLFSIVVMLLPALMLVLGPGSPAPLLCIIVALMSLGQQRKSTFEAQNVRRSIGSRNSTNTTRRKGKSLSKILKAKHHLPKGSASPKADLLEIITWALILNAGFFATGHNNEFHSLHVHSGLIGLNDFNLYISPALVVFNTFGVFILGSFLLPCLGLSAGFSLASGAPQRLCLNSTATHVSILKIWCLVVTLVTTVFVMIQRHHLMTWRVFAPKYCFDSINLLVGSVLLWVLEILCEFFVTRYLMFVRIQIGHLRDALEKSRR
eukprot:TRINITY_DN1288_c0_g3_i1.p1 TRINITY_DN1288_c0_g3~~TRINITY_DN1288_c0_g3_i1.p1  ORF type:complete len:1037 (+),score=302.64 TRINITY_DN1288_c0_g3_i1:24-3134(+)